MTPHGSEAIDLMMEVEVNNVIYSYDTLIRERIQVFHSFSTRQKELLFAIVAEGLVDKTLHLGTKSVIL